MPQDFSHEDTRSRHEEVRNLRASFVCLRGRLVQGVLVVRQQYNFIPLPISIEDRLAHVESLVA